ncbi:MAG: 3-hydroxyacyl-CoA dehydrogenase [Burkholderiales bacterium]|nr:3-hydroxyacyl-CoA dehydrogenase [Burkholderiales bacterium]
MGFDANRPDLLIGVIGAGAMGRGIAQVAAAGGIRVRLTDAKPGAAQEAVKFIDNMLKRAAEKGSIKPEDAKAAVERIQVIDSPADMKPCHAVIEAIIENPEIKQKLFSEIESIVGDDCIIASNTSSLSVTLLANKLKRPGRFAGFHFFNPVPLMRLVEVIDGVLTEPWVGEALMALGKRMTREPVRVKDAPGFLVNQVGRGYSLEASHLVAEGVASFVEVDRVMRDVGGFRMGPFELMDLTALDVTQPASELLYGQFFHEARYRPSLVMRSRLDAGIFGRKTKRGFYDYSSGEQVVPAEAPAPDARPRSVWVSSAEASGHASLAQLLDKLGAPMESGAKPSADALILVTPLGEDTTTCALEQGLDPKRTVAVDTLFPMVKRRTIMTCPITDPAYRDAAHGLLASDGVPVVATRDSPGLIAQRIIAMIVNIGCSVAQNRTASPADIDKAVTLGLNYPHGPLAFGDRLGPGRILKVLTNMQRIHGDQRYRPTLWLSRRARLGVSLLTPDN